MKDKNGKIIIIIMGLIIVALSCFIVYLVYEREIGDNNDKTLSENGGNDDTQSNEKYLTLYREKYSYDNYDDEMDIDILKIAVSSDEAFLVTSNGDYDMILYYDDGLKLYKEGKVTKLNLDYNENLSFKILNENYFAYYDNRSFDYEPTVKNNSGIYDLKSHKVLLKDEYCCYKEVDGDSFFSNYVVAYEYNKNKEAYFVKIINVKNLKTIISYDYQVTICNDITVKGYYSHWNTLKDATGFFTLYKTNSCGDNGCYDNHGKDYYVIYDINGKVLEQIKNNELVDIVKGEVCYKVYKYTNDSRKLILDMD